jgi:hypothetical protein
MRGRVKVIGQLVRKCCGRVSGIENARIVHDQDMYLSVVGFWSPKGRLEVMAVLGEQLASGGYSQREMM